jgi:hypothetical protein
VSEGNVWTWCQLFKESSTGVHDEERNGRPSLVTGDLKGKVNGKLWENRQFTISELCKLFCQPEPE